MSCRGFAHSAGIFSSHPITSSTERVWCSTLEFSCLERYGHFKVLQSSRMEYLFQVKGFPYSLPSIGPGADPDVQAVSPQVTVSHPPGGRLPLLSARRAVTVPATEHYHPLAGAKLYCLVTDAHRCKQLADGCYATFARSRIWIHNLLIRSVPPCRPLYQITYYKTDTANVLHVTILSASTIPHIDFEKLFNHSSSKITGCTVAPALC